ncbi:MAG: acyl-CoA thioesterase [Planctomycetaceae bacterium]|nr:acyl-CoA thioesterase [Planctomycetaceae bacterium]
MDQWHTTELRVRYSETDKMGLLHHSNYVSFFEIARTELFRAQGGDYRELEERGYFLVVVKIECNYKRPAGYDDVLAIRCRITKWSGAKLEHEYEVTRGRELLATGRSVLACVNSDFEIQRMSPDLLFGNGST